MIGDARLYSQKITRTTEQGGRFMAGICTEVGPIFPKQIGTGPCKAVSIICPNRLPTPTVNNSFFIGVGDSQYQPWEISPGVGQTFKTDRLDYIYVIRVFDWSGVDNTTKLNIGYIAHYDPPSEPYEAEGLNPRYYQPGGLSDYEMQVLAELRRIGNKG